MFSESEPIISLTIPAMKQEYNRVLQKGGDEVFAGYYALGAYYLSLGLKPDKVFASQNSYLAMLVLANKISLDEAIAGEHAKLPGDFPVELVSVDNCTTTLTTPTRDVEDRMNGHSLSICSKIQKQF
jgi:hypothetical protein